jgi:hypothetical protein
MGGGATGNSSPAPSAKDVKQNSNKSIPKAMALVTFFILNDKRVGRRNLADDLETEDTKTLLNESPN